MIEDSGLRMTRYGLRVTEHPHVNHPYRYRPHPDER